MSKEVSKKEETRVIEDYDSVSDNLKGIFVNSLPHERTIGK